MFVLATNDAQDEHLRSDDDDFVDTCRLVDVGVAKFATTTSPFTNSRPAGTGSIHRLS